MWIFVGVCTLLIVAFLFCLLPKSQKISTFVGGRKVLLITAHPDDECMFFAPTLLSLSSDNMSEVVLLCLSVGNYYKRGNVRKNELINSSSVLGLHSSNIKLIDDRVLPDSPTVEWNEDVVGKYIMETIMQNGTNVVMTFDDSGVSGHPNHIAICRAVRALKRQGRLQSETDGPIDVLLLETTGILRKYSSILDLVMSLIFARCHSMCDITGYFKGRQAMMEHKSQYVWFRKLYIIFSRYMFVNTFTKL